MIAVLQLKYSKSLWHFPLQAGSSPSSAIILSDSDSTGSDDVNEDALHLCQYKVHHWRFCYDRNIGRVDQNFKSGTCTTFVNISWNWWRIVTATMRMTKCWKMPMLSVPLSLSLVARSLCNNFFYWSLPFLNNYRTASNSSKKAQVQVRFTCCVYHVWSYHCTVLAVIIYTRDSSCQQPVYKTPPPKYGDIDDFAWSPNWKSAGISHLMSGKVPRLWTLWWMYSDIKKDKFGIWHYSGSHPQTYRVYIESDRHITVDKCGDGATGSSVVYLRWLHCTHPSNSEFKRLICLVSGKCNTIQSLSQVRELIL